jgi:hypothetical protein
MATVELKNRFICFVLSLAGGAKPNAAGRHREVFVLWEQMAMA